MEPQFLSYIAKKLRFHSLAGLENSCILLAVPVATVILFAVFARFEFAMLCGHVGGLDNDIHEVTLSPDLWGGH